MSKKYHYTYIDVVYDTATEALAKIGTVGEHQTHN